MMTFEEAVEILYEMVGGTNEPPIRERVEMALDVVHDYLVNGPFDGTEED